MRYLALFSFWILHLFAFELIEPLRQAKSGDYFLFSHKKNAALVVVRHVSQQEIIFHEIHAPLQPHTLNVQEWLAHKAPGHTSWIEVRLDSASGAVKTAFCHLRASRLPEEDQKFTTTLLTLPFKKIPNEERRRCGAPSRDNPLPRHLWEPPTPHGLKKETTEPFVSHWPKDGSELAGGRVEIYMLKGSPLPAWIEVRRANLKEHIRLIAKGRLNHLHIHDKCFE